MTNFATRTTTAGAVIGLAVMLSGCQLLGIGGQTRAAFQSETQVLPDDFGADQLAQGRQALLDGKVADAIDSFIIAKSYPEHAPAAFNGLAVAFSRIGRGDLTERYFQTAIALDPEEDRYRSNLALFYTHNSMARSAEPATVASAASIQPAPQPPVQATQANAAVQAVSAVRPLGSGVTVQASSLKLQRVSAGEVRIGTPVATRVAHQPVIHVGRLATVEYPVRITLSDLPIKALHAAKGD